MSLSTLNLILAKNNQCVHCNHQSKTEQESLIHVIKHIFNQVGSSNVNCSLCNSEFVSVEQKLIHFQSEHSRYFSLTQNGLLDKVDVFSKVLDGDDEITECRDEETVYLDPWNGQLRHGNPEPFSATSKTVTNIFPSSSKILKEKELKVAHSFEDSKIDIIHHDILQDHRKKIEPAKKLSPSSGEVKEKTKLSIKRESKQGIEQMTLEDEEYDVDNPDEAPDFEAVVDLNNNEEISSNKKEEKMNIRTIKEILEKKPMRKQSASANDQYPLVDCPICTKKVADYKLREHLIDHNDLYKQHNLYICSVCKETFKKKPMAAEHLKTHEPPPGDKNKSMKKRQLQILDAYQCPLCQHTNRYKFMNGLRNHIMEKHSNAKPILCDLCGNKFSCRALLITHTMQTHNGRRGGKKDVECGLCKGKVKGGGKGMWTHLRREHVGDERVWGCEVCEFACVGEDGLKLHRVKKH